MNSLGEHFTTAFTIRNADSYIFCKIERVQSVIENKKKISQLLSKKQYAFDNFQKILAKNTL